MSWARRQWGMGVVLVLAWALGVGVVAAQGCGPSQLGSPCGQGGPATLPAPGPSAAVGNPVHLATGNKHQREVDLPALPGPLGLELVRHYNAMDPRSGAFGPAWQLSYDTQLYDGGHRLAIVQPDGSRLDFTGGTSADMPCVPADPAHGTVRRVGVRAGDLPGERYVWRWPQGRRLSFDGAGRLLAITGADGGRLHVVRGQVPGTSAYGRVLRVTDPDGRVLALHYAGKPSVIARAVTPAGVIHYRYDTAGALIAAVYPDGHERRYAYDEARRRVGQLAMTDLHVMRPDGGTLRLGAWSYDSQGRVAMTYGGAPGSAHTRMTLHYARTPQGWRTTVSDAQGGQTQADLVVAGSRHALARMRGTPCPGCARPGTQPGGAVAGALQAGGAGGASGAGLAGLAGDAGVGGVAGGAGVSPARDGHREARDGPSGDAAPGQKAHGLPQRVRVPSVVPGRWRELVVEWQTVGTPHGDVRLPVGVRETGWRPVLGGQAQALGRGWDLRWQWQAAGMRLAKVSERGVASASPDRAAAGRDSVTVAADRSPGRGASAPPPGAATPRASPRMPEVSPGMPEVSPGMPEVSPGMPEASPRAAASVPGRQGPPATTAASMRRAAGQQGAAAPAWTPAADGWPGAAILRDDFGHAVAWRSDATGVERHDRDAHGRLLARHFANGQVWWHTYDDAGRLQSLDLGGEIIRIDATQGLASRVEHPEELETREHDPRGRLVRRSVRRPATGALRVAYTESFRHDPEGRVVTHRLPEGGALHYRWGARGRLLAIAWEDGRGRHHRVLDMPAGHRGRSGVGYVLGNGVRVRALWGEHGVIGVRHDAPRSRRVGLPPPVVLAHGQRRIGGVVVAEQWQTRDGIRAAAYAYDAQARLRAEAWQAPSPAGLGPDGHAQGPTAAAGATATPGPRDRPGRPPHPDPLGQAQPRPLATRDSGRPPHAALFGQAQPALLGQAQPPHAVPLGQGRSWSDDGSARAAGDGQAMPAILRDASGLPQRVGVRSLTYGPMRRLTQVHEEGRLIVAYRHNAYGQRIHRAPAQGPGEDFLFDAQRVVAVMRDGGVVRRYVYANNAPVAMIDYRVPQPMRASGAPVARSTGGGELMFLHADALGVPRVVTDARGGVRWQGDIDAFGRVRSATDDKDPGLRLPGQWHDPATGWHDNYLRTYDPVAGHYLEPDPLGPGDWLSLPSGVRARTSTYGYAAHQPRHHVDPLGLVLFAFDGTMSDATAPTNVRHFAALYDDPRQPGATVPIVAAPGTASATGWVDAALGTSGMVIVQQQWDRLVGHLAALASGAVAEPIDLVGYSRGGALARHFANRLVGQVRQGRFWQWVDGVGAVTACVQPRFMGLFDTVAQFGPGGAINGAFDFSIAPDWALVAHAVALHEQRRLFPLLSIAGADGILPANAIELPFVGAHADVGGGYGDTSGQRDDLSDVALAWMLDMARRVGVPLREPAPAQQVVEDPVLHDGRFAIERALQRHTETLAASLGLAPGWQTHAGLSYPDRAVLAANGSMLVDRQAGHTAFGQPLRDATEAFIARRDGWLADGEDAVGRVDLEAYARWLADREAP